MIQEKLGEKKKIKKEQPEPIKPVARKIKNREKMITKSNENKQKKVLIYGLDGTGKSYFAEQYCKEHDLHPAVLDFDDTNFVSKNIINFQLYLKPVNVVRDMLKVIEEVKNSDEYDTIVLDGIGTLFEFLVGRDAKGEEQKGLAKYAARAQYWKEIRRALMTSRLNLIIVGQMDMDIDIEDKENKPSKIIIGLHALVNEKYYCMYDSKDGFRQRILKYRQDQNCVDKLYSEIKKKD